MKGSRRSSSKKGKVYLLPGFRFHPTDVELLLYYLKRKVLGKKILSEPIPEVDIYNFAPHDLPGQSGLPTGDQEWYFFCHRDRKYSNGTRTKRSTFTGYWKTTGKDRSISHDSRIVGKKRTLIFYDGRAAHGSRTDWVIHEYKLEDPLWTSSIRQDHFVLCKLFKKSGSGPKNGEQHGSIFVEADWEDDEENETENLHPVLSPDPSVDGASLIYDYEQPVHPESGKFHTQLEQLVHSGAGYMSSHMQDVISAKLCNFLPDDVNGPPTMLEYPIYEMHGPCSPCNLVEIMPDHVPQIFDNPAELLPQAPLLHIDGMTSELTNELENMLMSFDGYEGFSMRGNDSDLAQATRPIHLSNFDTSDCQVMTIRSVVPGPSVNDQFGSFSWQHVAEVQSSNAFLGAEQHGMQYPPTIISSEWLSPLLSSMF